MTREEQIVNEANRQEELVNIDAVSFIEGAKWADKNPSNPWVLLSVDSPYNHEEYLDSSDCTVSVLVINDYGWTEAASMIKEDGKWSWMASLNNIVAWMPIPYFRYNHDHR